jgi:arylsulfatase A-like enzyme
LYGIVAVSPLPAQQPRAEREEHAMAAEFGLIEMMDAGIGRVLAALEQLGLNDDTMVVFTATSKSTISRSIRRS